MPYTEIRRPYVNGQPVGVVETEAGGSNGSNMPSWVQRNQVVTESMLEQHNGPVRANARGKLDPNKLGITLPPPTIAGKRIVSPGSVNSWFITNFCSFSAYSITITGAASYAITKDLIRITAGSAGTITLKVNGRDHLITVK